MSLVDFLKLHPRKTHLIFDFDETLFTLLLPWEKCLFPIADKLEKLDTGLLKKYYRDEIHLNDLQNEYVQKFGEPVRKLFYDNNVKFETESLTGVLVNRNLKQFLINNKSYEIFIWSSNTHEIIEIVLRKHRLLKKFKKIMTRSNLKFLKPDTEAFEAIYDLKVPKSSYLFIGDSLSDEIAAKNSGIDFFKVAPF